MEEENPLQILSKKSHATDYISRNKSGRPTVNKMVRFGPQPKSIIAQMLCEMKSNRTSGSNEDSDNTIFFDDDSQEDLCNELEKNIGNESGLNAVNAETPTITDQISQSLPSGINEDLNDKTKTNNEHEITKTKEFICNYPTCNYTCKLSSNLIKHKRRHTNEKPYLCDQCSFRTNFINSLKAHKRTHTAEKPYQCSYCSYKCNTSSNLKKHCRHRHSGDTKGHVT